MKHKKKSIFIDGPISPDQIAKSVAAHQSKTGIGAHDIFLGQVRADKHEGKTVTGIEYTAYREMAEREMMLIREEAFERFDLNCMHIYHSLGHVAAGELSLFVFASSPHREDAFRATRYIVDEIKDKVPIFGKEILDDGKHLWKENK